MMVEVPVVLKDLSPSKTLARRVCLQASLLRYTPYEITRHKLCYLTLTDRKEDMPSSKCLLWTEDPNRILWEAASLAALCILSF